MVKLPIVSLLETLYYIVNNVWECVVRMKIVTLEFPKEFKKIQSIITKNVKYINLSFKKVPTSTFVHRSKSQ
jgi:hypothetical protein